VVTEGSHVIVPDDNSGECVFIAACDPDDRIWVKDPGILGGYERALGWVRYPDGVKRKWPYQDIRLAPIRPASEPSFSTTARSST
jgi:hypothetical protein